ERYSATKPLARFSSAPEICPLHFTVEWAYYLNGHLETYPKPKMARKMHLWSASAEPLRSNFELF
ncbi:MAG: hypothetical protein WBX07_05265, partial [Rhodoplanes sp.]